MKTTFLKIAILLLLANWLFSGCSTKKYLKKDEIFIKKYRVVFTHKEEAIKVSDLKTLFRPKPNASILGVRWKVHNHFKAIEKPTKFNKWLDKSFGEYPVFYYPDDAERIEFKMKQYLNNVGFFNSGVTSSVEKKKRSVKLIYTVNPAKPYYISSITYDVPDTVLRRFFNQSLKESLVKEGDIYNAFTFDDERDRITRHLRDVGYYFFNRNYIQFIVDSAHNNHTLDVVLKINNIVENAKADDGMADEQMHRRYFVKNVRIIPDWKPDPGIRYDTVRHIIRFWNDKNTYYYDFLLDKKKRLKPAAFNSVIKIKPLRPYSATKVEKTYKGLFNFRIIRTATISFDTTGAGSAEDGSYDYMNSTVQIQTAKLNSFQIETEGTNSSGDLGIRGNLIFSNRNIFKMADVFSIRVNGGFEAQSITAINEGSTTNSLFNAFEAGFSGNFYFPRFLFPGRHTRFNQKYTPVTNINFGFSYQKRPNYDRNITNFDIGYTWDMSKQIKNIFTPININYVNVFPTPEFDSIIQNEPNQRLREQYSDHLIAGLSYSFIFNNQNRKVLRHFNYFRTNVETSGNLLYGLNKLFNSEKNDKGYYQIAGVRYAQYVRVNFDFRHYDYFFDKTTSFVFRVLFGIAVPYVNSSDIPYEKGYFAGGANDMRGWGFRTLGPGGYNGQNNYERVGDIQIESNFEYRFTIYNVIKGAFFLDIGNIWNLKESETFPNSKFEWNTWYQQLAADFGFGVRLDFNFFIFRLDMAVPLVDPAYWDTGDQVRLPVEWKRTVFNFGIGYPF